MASKALGSVRDGAEAASRWLLLSWLACSAVLVFIYRDVVADLWSVWTTQQDYSHGLLVAPFAFYLAWRNRGRLAGVTVRPSWVGAGLLVVAYLMRWAGVRCYYGSLERLSLVLAVWGTVLLVAGAQVARALGGPLLFLLLMVPPPGRVAVAVTLPLQRAAAAASAWVLTVMGWEVAREGNVLRLPLQSLEVAEACSGLRMVFAVVTLAGALVCLLRRPLWERAVLLVSAVPVGIVANVIRVVVTGVASETLGGAPSPTAVHDVAGWLMMPLALTLLWGEQRFLRSLFLGASRSQGAMAGG